MDPMDAILDRQKRAEARHTPGPWHLERDRAKSLSVYSGNEFIGEVWHEVDEPSIAQNANASLIAAAPDLLATLRAVEPLVVGALAFVDCNKQLEAVRWAIRKAEGSA